MTVQCSPYPAYKPSGIPWLGDIPAHWKVGKLKQTIMFCQNGIWGDEPDGKKDLPCVRVADFDRTRNRINSPIPTLRSIPITDASRRMLKNNDLLIEKSGGGDSQPVGTVVLFDLNVSAVCSNFIARIPAAPGYFPSFLCYLHTFLYSIRINTKSIKQNTGIQNLDTEAYFSEFVVLPPLPEQQAIAAYLDGETARLDALADRYRRLLALLDEKRRALITHAVTRGLNPTVPLKDSGIEWLGQIPAHWIFDRAKFIFRKMSRPTREEDDVVTAFRDGTVTLRSNRRTEGFTFSIKEIGYQGVRKGDLVIHQMDGFAGAIGVSDSDGKCTPIYSICTPIIPAITHYYGYLLRHMAKSDFILSLAKGIRERSSDFRFDVFRELVLPIPPLPEQQAIAAYLDQETTRLDGLKTKIETLLARLAEYRAALISAAVTGKMDVRDAAFETIQ